MIGLATRLAETGFGRQPPRSAGPQNSMPRIPEAAQSDTKATCSLGDPVQGHAAGTNPYETISDMVVRFLAAAARAPLDVQWVADQTDALSHTSRTGFPPLVEALSPSRRKTGKSVTRAGVRAQGTFRTKPHNYSCDQS